jgi:hypothetical protein
VTAYKNVGASVRARLLSRAKDSGSDYGLILTKYALERILYRLSVSQWSDAFLLKGALLFDLWFDQPHRPTRDIDLLGFGSSDLDVVAAAFCDVCGVACEDGMTFDATTVRAAEIRKEANYAGVRVTLLGILDGARCAVQIDVGYGDAVTPEPERMRFPVMLEDMAAPRLSCDAEPPCRRSYRWVCQTPLPKMPRRFASGRLFSTRTNCRRHHWMNWSARYAHRFGDSGLRGPR